MGLNLIHKRANEGIWNLPIWGNAADVLQGAFLKKGTTPGTNNGALMTAESGTSTNADNVGRLAALLDYSEDGETLVAGTSFVTKPVILNSIFRIHRIEYSLVSADLITCTQAVTTTTITVTSLEDNIDAAFLYVDEGTGAGQTNYLTASASGSATLKAAFGTSLDTTSKFVKIIPRFNALCGLTSDGTKLQSTAAAGGTPCMVIDSYIERNGRLEQLNPVKHAALTGLNGLRSLRFYADVAFRDTLPNTLD